MAKIRVRAMKDIWYETGFVHLADGRKISNGRKFRKGDVFEIEEKDFSDFDNVKEYGSHVVRGSMRRVESKIEGDKIVNVDVEKPTTVTKFVSKTVVPVDATAPAAPVEKPRRGRKPKNAVVAVPVEKTADPI